MRAAGTPPVHIAGRGQDGGLQLHRGVLQSRPSPFWHTLSIPNRLRDADAQGDQNDLSDKPSTKPGQLQVFTPEGLRHLIAEVGAGQIVMGTDYPFPWTKTAVDHILTTPGLSDAERVAILGETAANLLAIKPA